MQACRLYQRLTSRIDIRAMQRVTRNDFYVRGKVLIECSQLWSFAGGLATDNRTGFGRFYTGQRASYSCEDGLSCGNVQGPYCATIFSITAASTL